MTASKLSRCYRRRELPGGPRHLKVRCLAACGWTGVRTCDTTDDLVAAKPCPRCGSGLKLLMAHA